MSIDYARTGLLLRIVHDSAGTPAFANILGRAGVELDLIDEECGKELEVIRAEAAKKAAADKAKFDAEEKARLDKEKAIEDAAAKANEAKAKSVVYPGHPTPGHPTPEELAAKAREEQIQRDKEAAASVHGPSLNVQHPVDRSSF